MRYFIMLGLFLCGCATKPCQVLVSEGDVVVLRHYAVASTNGNTISYTTNYVIGTLNDGKLVELITVERETK